MTPALLDRPAVYFDAIGGAPQTLDGLIVDAWEAIASGRPASCAVCGGETCPSTDGRASVECVSCHSRLS